MSRHSRSDEEMYVEELVEESDRKYDKLQSWSDVGSLTLLAGSVFAGAMVGTTLSITLGFIGFCVFGAANIGSRFIIEKKKTAARREIRAGGYNKDKQKEENKPEQILARDKQTSEQLDMMHQFEIDEYERNKQDEIYLGHEESIYMDRLERRTDRNMFGRHDIER